MPRFSTVMCEDLALAPGNRNGEDGLGEPVIESLMLERSARIPLTRASAGEIATHLRVSEPVCVDVLRREGKATKVAIPRTDDVLYGWVPSDALGPVDLCHGRVGLLGHAAGTATGRGFGVDATATCATDMPIVLELAGRRRRVGFVRAGTRMVIDDAGSKYVAIDASESKVTLAEGVKLLVERARLEGCELEREPKLERAHRPNVWPRTAPRTDSH